MISVLSDPIFRVKKLDGTTAWVGLRDLIVNANTYADLQGRTPTGRCALMRLCIAFLEDMLRPEDLAERRDLFEEGRFDPDVLDRYIVECEKDGPRFLLDDPDHPFMQAPYDPELDAKAEKPIAALMMDVPSGHAHVHTDHRMETEHALNAAEAFEAMLETYLFCKYTAAGSKSHYPKSINDPLPIYIFVRGKTLFETLVLNMLSMEQGEELNYIPFGAADVPWRKGVKVCLEERVSEMSFLRALTWQPRRVTLCFDEDQMVRRCYFQPGLDFSGDGRWKDPHVAYRVNDDGSFSSVKPQQGRQMWRDVGNLLAGMHAIQPIPLKNSNYILNGNPDTSIRVEMIGIAADFVQAIYYCWTQETLRLPEVFLRDAEMANVFRGCVNTCEEIVGMMAKVITKEMGKQISEQACAQFLLRMRNELFDRTMIRILNWEAEWQAAFVASTRETLLDVLDQVVNRSGTSVDMLKRQGRVAGILMHYTNEIMKGW